MKPTVQPAHQPGTDQMDGKMAGRSIPTGQLAVATMSLLVAVAFSIGSRAVTAQPVGEVFQDCEVCPQMIVVPGAGLAWARRRRRREGTTTKALDESW